MKHSREKSANPSTLEAKITELEASIRELANCVLEIGTTQKSFFSTIEAIKRINTSHHHHQGAEQFIQSSSSSASYDCYR